MSINKSALRTIGVLELLSKCRELTLTEISESLQMPLASTSDIVKALLDTQMVEYANKRAKTYKLGVTNYLLGNAYLARLNIVEIAAPFMEELADQTKYVVFLAKLTDNEILYLHKASPIANARFVSTCQVGHKARISTTSLGKTIMAYNEWLQDKVLSEPLPQITENSITDPSVLRKELEEIRINSYSRDNFENDERITCVGFPIFDQRGRVDHSLSISGYFSEDRDMEKEIELGKICSQNISLRMGFVGL
ncbi:MAG: IclR family transcriptional regulator [Defluviitaleaceae bacterium]|nr:IclR family transcriptional regulator [Defluviitaleaceae bacterium]